MESIIKWQTGEPTCGGRYLVVIGDGIVTCDLWQFYSLKGKMKWVVYRNDEVKYWHRVRSIQLNNKAEDYVKLSN